MKISLDEQRYLGVSISLESDVEDDGRISGVGGLLQDLRLPRESRRALGNCKEINQLSIDKNELSIDKSQVSIDRDTVPSNLTVKVAVSLPDSFLAVHTN